MKRCPVCGGRWKDHFEEGSLLISPNAHSKNRNTLDIYEWLRSNACYVRYTTHRIATE